MAKFETKHNVGDTVYYLNDELTLDDSLQYSGFFAETMACIESGVIEEIKVTKDGLRFVVNGSEFNDESAFFNVKEAAYTACLKELKQKLKTALSNIDKLVKETDFDTANEQCMNGEK